MHIIEKSKINRSAEKVWPFIITPEHYQSWNTKVVSMDAKGQFVLNQPFTTRYKMGRKEMQCNSMATAINPEHFLEIKHTNCVGTVNDSELVVYERIRLEDEGGQTIVTKEVDIQHHTIPWMIIPFIWFVTRFGKSVEPDRLKLMCEMNLSSAAPLL